MLASQGWRVVERIARPEWWIDQLWIVESSWSPVGQRA
jgi:hypothetical protein